MKKILVVVRNLNKGGGISEFVVNNYNELAKMQDLKIEVLVEEGFNHFEEFQIDPNLTIKKGVSLSRNPFKYIMSWQKIKNKLRQGEYDVVHIHTDNLVRFFNLFILRKMKNVIIHSHSSYNEEVQSHFVKRSLHKVGKNIIKNSNMKYYSCSDLAAKWLFDNQKYVQINNGIKLDDFRFNEIKRQRYREELNLSGKIVYGHVGRFTYPKNHEKLINIFFEIEKKDKNSFLILVGEGEKKEKIIQLVSDLNLTEKVLFMGLRTDVSDLMNSFDKIIFPSYYEGFPLVLVEAQANGLPVYFSDSVTHTAKILDETQMFSLEDSDEAIAEMILTGDALEDREAGVSLLKSSGYDHMDVIRKVYTLYKES